MRKWRISINLQPLLHRLTWLLIIFRVNVKSKALNFYKFISVLLVRRRHGRCEKRVLPSAGIFLKRRRRHQGLLCA